MYWSQTCSNCANPVASPLESTEYCVIGVDVNGCKDTACVKITVENPCQNTKRLGVPNAFSPNGDEVNDAFCLLGWEECIVNFKISIYNRWGQRVYISKDSNFCWDGKFNGEKLDAQVLVYHIEALFTTGPIKRTGNISLIR